VSKLVVNYTNLTDESIYERIAYPAGELQIRIKPQYIELVELAKEIVIQVRLQILGTEHSSAYTMHANLAGLVLLSDALHGINPTAKQILQLPYLPYSRADRRFVDGDCHGLATFGKMLEAGEFREVVTLDVHNYNKAHMFIRNLVNVVPRVEILQAIVDFEDICKEKPAILFPDAGAAKRYKKLGCIPADMKVYYCEKHRDVNGKFIGFKIPDIGLLPLLHSSFLIIDDLCDGGGTFNDIARLLEEEYGTETRLLLGLYITTGIFSKGLFELARHFRKIYFTDSIRIDQRVFDSGTGLLKTMSAFAALECPDNTRMTGEE